MSPEPDEEALEALWRATQEYRAAERDWANARSHEDRCEAETCKNRALAEIKTLVLVALPDRDRV